MLHIALIECYLEDLFINADLAAISDLNIQDNKKPIVSDMKSSWIKPIEVFKEPYLCSALRNLLLSFPGIFVEPTSCLLYPFFHFA